MIEPIDDQLDGRSLSELPPRDAADVLELVAWLQPVRAGAVALPVLTVSAVLDRTGAASGWLPLMWTLTLTLILILPIYMLALGLIRATLARSPHSGIPIRKAHPRAVTATYLAPAVATALSLLLGIVAH
ncbi:hypothetical protein [Actinopolymorpha rutila]|uniref:VIT1/CCC1 family predicted Fe2+/Mn2+ transporter n=1 Tax=Actinopolymorpha rutila TaxID=446787 RepID=A0A852ZV96_9ACTN|nr:hypothetical protein [Actinopolymorpha rutila]NYH92890.1 VIT1/CCC1 family predicted Fe2+/Mn2+ transporter [Actinopolymorpha rutila]